MPMKTLDIGKGNLDLKALLSMLVPGTEVLLRDGGKPVARVVPAGERIPGLHMGAIRTRKDFDEPLSEDFWAGRK